MSYIIRCKKCQRLKEHYAKHLCKTCYNEPYVLTFRMKPGYKDRHCAYQLKYYIKQVLKENEEQS